MRKYDFLIVGAGLYGATFAHMVTKRGLKCLVIDRRSHAGGNLYCENIEGINVHRYGAHIFHTDDVNVWNFVTSLVPFNRFTNCPLAITPDGRLLNLPFNMNTFHALWGVRKPSEALAIIESQRKEALDKMKADGASEPRNLEEQALCLVGRDIYEALIKGYTEKQWGRPCTALPAFIIRRLPVRLSYDNNYFNDCYQGIPVGGYNPLISRLLEGSEFIGGLDFMSDRKHLASLASQIVFTGRIDEYFDFRFGPLDYRSVDFDTKVMPIANFQGNAVVNFTSSEVPYTRIIEHKHFESFGERVYDNPATVVSYEYPSEFTTGKEPFYPVNDNANQERYQRYRALADKEPNVIFGGRLAEYRYYDMAPIISKAFSDFNLWDSKN